MKNLVPIANFERKYEIAPDGRVWNKNKDDWQTLTQNPNGYMKAQLSLNGKKDQLLVHRLVARHFIPNPYNHPQVNHIDGDKTNNTVGNLEWVDRSQNIQHSLREGLRKGYMSPREKRHYLQRVLQGEVISDIASEIGRHPVSLSKMLRTQATKDGLEGKWTRAMKERRRNAALKNLERINN